MLKLSNALSGWKPDAKAPHTDPLVLLAAAWNEIVGPDVGQNSRPVRILDRTLHVTTRSSAWSQQLTFLAEHVLAAVRARLPSVPLDRLRFRVGPIVAAAERPAPQAFAHGPVRRPGPRPPSQTAQEAVARFRDDVERSQRAKRDRGWKECTRCAALVAPGASELCIGCASAQTHDRAVTTAQLLFEAPWLGYAGTAALVEGLKETEYDRIRAQVLARWWETLVRARAAKRLSRDRRERLIASSYVVLRSQLPPEEIVPATLRSLLGDELHDLIYERKEMNVE